MTDPKKLIAELETKFKAMEKLVAELKTSFADLARLAKEQADEINYFEDELEGKEETDD